MGVNQTYDLTAILFYIVGMVFGQSYSVQHVKPLLWVQTSPCKRMIRTILGVTLAGLLYSPFYFGSKNTTSQMTKFMFRFCMPALVISFIMYGVFPIMCKYMKLVADVSPYVTKRQRSINQRSVSVAMPGTLQPLAGNVDQKSRAFSENAHPGLDSPARRLSGED
jgi:hypothetical protein